MEKHPWVSKANAERIFWNKIRVTVENHDIAMQWGSEGFISSINDSASIYISEWANDDRASITIKDILNTYLSHIRNLNVHS